MAKRRTNRKHSIIDGLDPALKEAVEELLLSGATYSEVVDFLQANGVGISIASVCRYAKGFCENLEMLAIAQENFRRMMDEMNKYPELDTTEAIIRLASQNVFRALANASEDDWSNVKIDKMLTEANGLIRAAAYKKRVEVQNQEVSETGLDAVKALVFEAMAREQPELYKQVSAFLERKSQEGLNKEGS